MLVDLFSTDVGLLSLAVIVFIVGMAIYLLRHFIRLANTEPGDEGWK